MLQNFISEYEGVRSDIKYKFPFYSRNKPICYLNPLKKVGAGLVFWNALEMTNSLSLRDMKKRKWFAGISYDTIDEVDFNLLNKMLLEAISIDGSLSSNKLRKQK